MSSDTITLEEALTLLTLPRVVGVDPETGEEITAQNGRYGPYLKKGTDSRSIESEEKLLTITLERGAGDLRPAQAAGPGRGQPGHARSATDPVSGNRSLVKSGRFGTYVTDGEYNATLRQGDDETAVTLERAAELLEERRAKGPAKKAGQEDGEEDHREEDRGEEDHREEDHGEEDHREEDRGQEDRHEEGHHEDRGRDRPDPGP